MIVGRVLLRLREPALLQGPRSLTHDVSKADKFFVTEREANVPSIEVYMPTVLRAKAGMDIHWLEGVGRIV
jgi:hypothetical protein